MIHFGWRSVFYTFAAISFIVGAYWMLVTKKANMTDAVFHQENLTASGEKKVVPAIFDKPFTKVELWGSSIAWYSNSYVFSFLVLWLPMYLIKGRGMSIEEMAIFGSIPWAFLFIMMNVAGYIVDWVKNNTKHSIFWRRMIFAGGYLWCAVFIVMIQNVQTSQQALIYICTSFVGLAFTWPVGFSLPIEYAGPKAGIATGFMNSWGQMAAIISPIITGYVASTNDWGKAFWWAAVFSLAGAVVVLVTSKYNTGVTDGTNAPQAVVK
jgi:ACS family glucarate transporter-like MFS transporter